MPLSELAPLVPFVVLLSVGQNANDREIDSVRRLDNGPPNGPTLLSEIIQALNPIPFRRAQPCER